MIQSPNSGNSSEFFKKAGSVFTSFNHEAGQVGDMDVDEMDMIYNKIDKLVREVDARQWIEISFQNFQVSKEL